MLHSAYFVLAVIALLFALGSAVKPEKLPLWIAVVFACVAMLVDAYAKS